MKQTVTHPYSGMASLCQIHTSTRPSAPSVTRRYACDLLPYFPASVRLYCQWMEQMGSWGHTYTCKMHSKPMYCGARMRHTMHQAGKGHSEP